MTSVTVQDQRLDQASRKRFQESSRNSFADAMTLEITSRHCAAECNLLDLEEYVKSTYLCCKGRCLVYFAKVDALSASLANGMWLVMLLRNACHARRRGINPNRPPSP